MGPENRRRWREDCDILDHYASARRPELPGHPDRHRLSGPAVARRRARSLASDPRELAARERAPKVDASLHEVVADIRGMRLGRHGALPHSTVVANADAWRRIYPRAVA